MRNGKKVAAKQPRGKSPAVVIDRYLERRNPALKEVANGLRSLVKKAVPQSREDVNPWGIPVFDFHGPFCLLMAGKNHITFGFTRGTSLADPGKLLEGTGKNLRHVKVKEKEQLRDTNLRQLIRNAAALNRETPLTSTMRVKKPG